MPSSPARRSVGIGPLMSTDLSSCSSRERLRPLVLVADDHAAVASVISRSLGGLAPVTSLDLLARVVPGWRHWSWSPISISTGSYRSTCCGT